MQPTPIDLSEMCGVADNVRSGVQPLNGLRHPREKETSGWYLWAGEDLLTDPDFFKPVHVAHVLEVLPWLRTYLELPPGYRFLLADGHEDVWFDATLLNT